MNHCSSCDNEFRYWEVWISFWKGLKIDCPSCAKRNSVNIFIRFLLNIGVILFPVLIVFFGLQIIWPAFNVIYGLLSFIVLGYLVSLIVPLFRLYGK